MARVTKEYFYPKEREEKKRKPELRFAPDGTQMALSEDFGWGRKWQAAGGNAEQYSNTARELLKASAAEAKARAANPDQALKAQYQEKELGAIAEMLGLKKKQGEAGITAMLGQLGLGEKPGGGMESVKGMSPELKAKLGIATGSSYSKPPELDQSPVQEMFPVLESFKQSSMLGQPAYNITNTFDSGIEAPVTERSQLYNELIEATKPKKVGTPKTGREQEIYNRMKQAGWL